MSRTVKSASHTDHVVQFYEDDGFLCQEVGRFLGAGLGRNEATLVIATDKHLRGIATAMETAGFDLDGARASGQLVELDAEEFLHRFTEGSLRHGMPDPDQFDRVVGGVVRPACADGRFSGVRAYGEMVDLFAERGNVAAAAKLEGLWNQLGREHRFQLLCGYSMGNFRRSEDFEAFQHICSVHEHVRPAETYDERSSHADQRRRIAELQQRAYALEAEVAERRKLERTIVEEQERLLEANRRKDEFIALLSHELRNPLAPILTSLDIMDVRGDSSSRREREIIRRQARHLATLVEDLLDLSRVASGKVSLQKQLVEFASIADTAIEMTSPLFQERHHTLELSIPTEGLLLEADPVRLPQVVGNLLTNAAKYTPVRGRVAVRAERRGSEIVVTVEDNGIGIPRDAIADIFAPFVQGRQSIDRAGGGLGLGLTLVRSITQLHGGTVTAESDGPGKGSRFVLRLPAARAAAPVTRRIVRARDGNGTRAHANGKGALPDRRRHASSGRRVLVVDDNRDAALALTHLIGQLGFDVRTAHDGAEAMAVSATFGPEVALVDIGLPSMDGYALATRLRGMRDGAPLRLIAITGYGQATDRAKSMLAGFDAHAVKPVDLEVLRGLLANLPKPALG